MSEERHPIIIETWCKTNGCRADVYRQEIRRFKDEKRALEARLSEMDEALGDGGDLEHAADLLQTATNDHGVDQSFNNNPYSMSDYLRKLADLAGER